MNVPMGAVVVLLTVCFVEESRNERAARFDVSGQTLFIVTVGAFRVCDHRRSRGRLDVAPHHRAAVGGRRWLCPVLVDRAQIAGSDDGSDLVPRRFVRGVHRDHLHGVFAVYGMLLLTTQFLQNVRGYTRA